MFRRSKIQSNFSFEPFIGKLLTNAYANNNLSILNLITLASNLSAIRPTYNLTYHSSIIDKFSHTSKIGNTCGCKSKIRDTCGCKSKISNTYGYKSKIGNTCGCKSKIRDTYGYKSKIRDTYGYKSKISNTCGC